MNSKTHPALVAQAAAQRLPRLALLLFCAAYVLPGVFGRDPWRGADISNFGQMLAMAEGRSSWMLATLGGVPTGSALLPNWIGAASIWLATPWLDPALAARIPFALLLVLTLVAVWYSTFHLARSKDAQPLPFAFGGEASSVDYARAIADGALLAVIATLGLLRLGHETTPELAQLASVASFQWALAAAPQRNRGARAGALLALSVLAASGAPAMAVALGLGALALSLRDGDPQQRALAPWLAAATGVAALVAWPVHSWAWRLEPRIDVQQLGRLWLWFLWPAWALACWTLWRWRGHLLQRHLAAPLLSLVIAVITSIAMGGSDRPLMLGLPGIAVLAAFALPTLKRSASAAIDWFSVFFFSAAALIVWFYFLAAQTGVPGKAAASVFRFLRGFEPRLSIPELVLAVLGTLAWLWLVRWRTSRHRAALWKSLVLPAGGVALLALLAMTLWLPALDYALSFRPVMERLRVYLPITSCVAAPDATPSLIAALEYHAKRRVDASPAAAHGPCQAMVLVRRGKAPPPAPAGWRQVAAEPRPNDRNEFTLIYRR